MNPHEDSPWSAPGTVTGFAQSAPNPVLMRFAAGEIAARGRLRTLDIGCGAGRNAVPLARLGANVLGTDLSRPMLAALLARLPGEPIDGHLRVALAAMDALPVRSRSMDFLIAHGIWNLARSGAEFRAAVGEAARVAAPGAALFVFTFSRETIAPEAAPVVGETFVFRQFSGGPQIFLTEEQLYGELDAAGFVPDPGVPLTVYNRPRGGSLRMAGSTPVIFEAAFRFRG
jgi:SAM-dependent methyltransferase